MYLVEYLASFWNPEAVKKIKEERERKKLDGEIKDDQFIDQMKDLTIKNESLINAIKSLKKSTSDGQNGDQTSLPYGSINLNKIIKDNL